jgi:hypothetical protein
MHLALSRIVKTTEEKKNDKERETCSGDSLIFCFFFFLFYVYVDEKKDGEALFVGSTRQHRDTIITKI